MNLKEVMWHIAVLMVVLSIVALARGDHKSFVFAQLSAIWVHLFRLSL